MKNLLKKLIEWLINLFSSSTPPTPLPSPTPIPINPVTVMVTNRDGQRNIVGVKINEVPVEGLHYPIAPMDQSIGITKQLHESCTVTVLFNGSSVNEQIVIGNACVDTKQSEMCIVDYVNTIYGVTIHYQNSPCNKVKTPKSRKKKSK